MRRFTDLSLLLLRLVTGIGFIVHGWAKLSKGPQGFEKLLIQLHIPLPHIMSWVTPYVEFLGGLALLIGLFTRIISIPLIVTMLVALFTIHIHYGFSSIKTIGLNMDGPVFGPPGYEINLLYIAILITFVISGGGRFSADELLKRSYPGKKLS